MLLFPITLDVPMARWPWMNWLLIAGIVLAFLLQLAEPEYMLQFILGIDELELADEHALSWVVHMFLHADVVHLIGNLWFMWVFGNAVCAKVGNLWYLPLWIGFGLISAVAEPYGLGASGAINGVIGFCLVFYPINHVTMFYFILVRGGSFSLSSYWMILMWLAFDILGLVTGAEYVAYLSHVAGFAAGAVTAVALLATKRLKPTKYERTLLDLVKDPKSRPPRSETRLAGDRHDRRLDVRRLHVQLADGTRKFLPLDEFRRHERMGKPVNHLRVSEDGKRWTTYGEWCRQHGV